MDILKSSNVERVLFDKFGAKRTKELMESLNQQGFYQLSGEELKALQEDFDADFTTDEEIKEYIRTYALQKSYLMDPHTATTIKLYERFRSEKNIAYSTAEWTKFAPTVLNALRGDSVKYSDLEALTAIAKMMHIPIPVQIEELFNKPIVHDTVIEKEMIEEEILKFLQS